MSDPGQIRASDADREETVGALREHFAAVVRSAWRLYGPSPELDRVQAELRHRGHGHGVRRVKHARRRELP
jgi:hypothetical protein